MKRLLSLLLLGAVFFSNIGQLNAQDETASEEALAVEEVAQEVEQEDAPSEIGFTQELKNRFIEGGPG